MRVWNSIWVILFLRVNVGLWRILILFPNRWLLSGLFWWRPFLFLRFGLFCFLSWCQIPRLICLNRGVTNQDSPWFLNWFFSWLRGGIWPHNRVQIWSDGWILSLLWVRYRFKLDKLSRQLRKRLTLLYSLSFADMPMQTAIALGLIVTVVMAVHGGLR